MDVNARMNDVDHCQLYVSLTQEHDCSVDPVSGSVAGRQEHLSDKVGPGGCHVHRTLVPVTGLLLSLTPQSRLQPDPRERAEKFSRGLFLQAVSEMKIRCGLKSNVTTVLYVKFVVKRILKQKTMRSAQSDQTYWTAFRKLPKTIDLENIKKVTSSDYVSCQYYLDRFTYDHHNCWKISLREKKRITF